MSGIKIGDRVRHQHGFGHATAIVVRMMSYGWLELKNDAGHQLYRRAALVELVPDDNRCTRRRA